MARKKPITVQELKNKYPLLYIKIIEEAAMQGKYNVVHSSTVSQALVWNKTSQGHVFWSNIFRGDFDITERIHPELFIVKEEHEGYSLIKNGLFHGG